VCSFPVGREVVEKQDGIEELGEIFDADSGQFFEDFTGNEVIAREFFGIEMVDGSLGISIGETGLAGQADMGSLRLVGWVVQPRGVDGGGGGGVRGVYGYMVVGERLGFQKRAPCPGSRFRLVFVEEGKVSWRVSGTCWFSIRSSQWTLWGLGSVGRFGRNHFCAGGEVV
jgi:hypothetical protein